MPDIRRAVTVDARPQGLDVDLDATAVIVVDMQNDFGSRGGMFDLAGIDIAGIQAAVEPTRRVLVAARALHVPVVYLKMGFAEDLSDTGGPASPNFIKHQPLRVGEQVRAPDGSLSRILVRDHWNTEILPALEPQPGDISVWKTRFSGFFGTELDDVLRSRSIGQLVFTGCTTSVCVEATMRDAMYRGYQCLLLEDCTAEPIGDGLPRSNHEASLLTMQILYGWVSDSTSFLSAAEARLPS